MITTALARRPVNVKVSCPDCWSAWTLAGHLCDDCTRRHEGRWPADLTPADLANASSR